jgi:hypothetical protein
MARTPTAASQGTTPTRARKGEYECGLGLESERETDRRLRQGNAGVAIAERR